MSSWVQGLPKFDLHVHLDGSMRPETVIELAQFLPPDRRFPPDFDLHKALTPPQRCTLEEYLQAFKITGAVLQSEETLERAAYELCEDAAREDVIYMEIRFAPLLHVKQGLFPNQVIESVLTGMRRAEETYPFRTSLIVCGLKHEPPERSIETAQLGAEYRDAGVVGFDLAGPENGFPPALHHEAIEIARRSGLHVTIHAGEGCCPAHIREAIDLGAERIGHGVYLYQDPETEKIVRERGITLEVCPTSNLQISGVMNSYSEHPFKRYLDEGIPVTINTDNRLMSQIDVTHELEQMIEAFSLSRDQVKDILLNSASAAFVSEEVRELLRKQVTQAFRLS
ncbi:MAG TPA: adenosine deaminase [Candidatus Acetothermia bacterium]|nr:adenosine deaminase [Candidatus Acetothermia bacterium]